MKVFTAILMPDADGSLHLPLPVELQHCKVKVEATLKAADKTDYAAPSASSGMLRQRAEALSALRTVGGLKDIIPDPLAWQLEQREDRRLPGRE